MKKAIIMPTIQVPPNLSAWASQLDDDDCIIIAGNEISPHNEINDALEKTAQTATKTIDTTYLHPNSSYCRSLRINPYMEPNHHHRRNFALMYALEAGADVIITLDDDNFPVSKEWVDVAAHRVTEPNTTLSVLHSNAHWINPGVLCYPPVTHRGYPLSLRRKNDDIQRLENANNESVGVFASLWLGDPDIDAIERIHDDPMVRNIEGTFVWGIGNWAPFDSQSTAIARRIAPLLFMWPYVGRYDDIWASYLARAVMDHRKEHIVYGTPAVRQERNPHNLLKDLDAERLGYEHTEKVCEILRNINFDYGGNDIISQMHIAIEHLGRVPSGVPLGTIHALHAWIDDVDDRIGDTL